MPAARAICLSLDHPASLYTQQVCTRCRIVGTHSVELQSLQDQSYWIVMVNEKQWNPGFQGFPLRSANRVTVVDMPN